MTAPIVTYKGLYYDKTEEIVHPRKLPCTMTVDRYWKLLQRGTVTMNFHHNSSKFSPEAVLSVYTRNLPIREPRADNNNWNRMELPFPISSETRDFFLECARVVDAKLRGL